MKPIDLERYQRQITLPNFGLENQEKLSKSSVVIIGAGGLGVPVSINLTAMGFGKIRIIDFDVVEKSNLPRQNIYLDSDVGKSKVKVLSAFLKKQNPEVEIESFEEKLDANNALDLISGYDVVVDATDNFPARYLINDASVKLGLPLVYGSIFRFEGQVSVFNHKNDKGEFGPNFRDLFHELPNEDSIPSCRVGGVIGVLPSIIGNFQALEVVKIATGLGKVLSGEILVFNALNSEMYKFNLKKNELNTTRTVNSANIYLKSSVQLGSNDPKDRAMIKEITVQDLQNKITKDQDYQLIDVREPDEYQFSNIGGHLIPMNDIAAAVGQVKINKPVVIMCRSGQRSAQVINYLQEKHGFDNLYNLKGGILAWSREIDSTVPTY